MNPIAVPASARAGRPECQLVDMGPPPGVSDEDCGTLQMLISGQTLLGFPGRAQYAYFRPSPAELELLNAGGFLEMCQLGQVVQPFSLAVWPADGSTTDGG